MRKPSFINLWIFLTIPILTELLSGNQPFSHVFSPGGYLFLFFAYSIPALLIHELRVRWNLGIMGLFVLGLAYGIFNEGVLAQTLFMTGQRIPISTFIGYNKFGINLPWTATMLPWHALHSIIYPLTILYTLYPQESTHKRFSTIALILIAIFYFVMGTLVYINPTRGGTTFHLLLSWGLIIGLIALSRVFPKQPRVDWPQEGTIDKKPSVIGGLLTGFPLMLFLIVPMIVASTHIPTVIQLLINGGLYIFVYWLFKKRNYFALPGFTFIALGHYFAHALLGTAIVWKDMDRLRGEIVVLSLLMFLIWRVSSKLRKA